MKALPMISGKPIYLAVFLGIFAVGVLVIYTQRLELLALVAVPLAAAPLVLNYRVAVVVTTWAMLIWLSRIPAALFDIVYFSYVVYFCLAATVVALLMRIGVSRRYIVPRDLWILGLLVIPVALAGMRGAAHVYEIPNHMLIAWMEVSLDARTYLRTFVITPLFQPLLAFLIAAAVGWGLNPVRLMKPGLIMVWVFSVMVIGYVVTTGEGVGEIAQRAEATRSEYLFDMGLHANAYGLFLATAYAFMLSMVKEITNWIAKRFVLATMGLATIAIFLTFSRSAVVAFGVVNLVHFWKTDSRKKTVLVALLLLVWLVVPVALFDRFQIGLDSGNADVISTGRVDHIWLPLIPDITDNLLLGQGLYSIYWTHAQQFALIYPVVHSHNFLLDLLLDFGVVGTVPVLAFYAYVWRSFLRLSTIEREPLLWGFFRGGHLAMIVTLLGAMVNGRLTPEHTHILLWIAIGIAFGRLGLLKRQAAQAFASRPVTVSETGAKYRNAAGKSTNR